MTTPAQSADHSAHHLAALAGQSRAWPFEEARKLLQRVKGRDPLRPVLFETGYGPSGLPHIGTFGEVSRTAMVRHAFQVLTEHKLPTRLICFSDDMDGMRKVPDNVPNKELLRAHLHKPLTKVPDPFGEFESFGHHNNAMLRSFLDHFGFDYEFASATDYYAEGRFDEMLLRMLSAYDEVMAIMLPTLREERRRTYAPFLPVHPETGAVMQVPIEARNAAAGTIVWTDPGSGNRYETPVTGGACKAQWKPDWALRWAAMRIDYEMSGKDHIDNVKISSRICKVLGGTPPDGFNYELFLDDKGEKISKSKGNGLTIDDWLRYASPESLSLYMYQSPRKAKRLHFDVIPRNVEDYLTHLGAYHEQEPAKQLDNPVWHIHSGEPPEMDVPISFSMLLNLVSASNAHDKNVLWGFIQRYAPQANAQNHPKLDELAGYAISYFHDFVLPQKVHRLADDKERAAFLALDAGLATAKADASAEELQAIVYEVGKSHRFDNLRDWFKAIYEVLLGETQGPRFGSFVALYGIPETRALIARALNGELVK